LSPFPIDQNGHHLPAGQLRQQSPVGIRAGHPFPVDPEDDVHLAESSRAGRAPPRGPPPPGRAPPPRRFDPPPRSRRPPRAPPLSEGPSRKVPMRPREGSGEQASVPDFPARPAARLPSAVFRRAESPGRQRCPERCPLPPSGIP